MKESRQYIVPAMLATLLHAALIVFMVVGFAMPAPKPITPLAIQATLVQEDASAPPPVARPEPELEPEPEPEPVEPEPDTAELERQKRIEDARIEQQRLNRIEEAKREAERERQRRAEEEARKLAEEQARKEAEEAARKKAEDEARRKAEEEARLEAARIEAERKRQEDIERQRAENERRRREAEAAARQAEIDAEARRLDAMAAGARDAYIFAIQQKITRNWAKPPSAPADLECRVAVRQMPGGDVVSVDVLSCNGDAAVVRSVESAVFRASPLPDPPDPSIFERNLTIIFKPRQ